MANWFGTSSKPPRLLHHSAVKLWQTIHGHNEWRESRTNISLKATSFKTTPRNITFGAAFILLANVTIIAVVAVQFGNVNGVATLHTGDCGKVSWIDSGLHAVINIFSSILLGMSSYMMQVLNAPTRDQLDSLHRRGKAAQIGTSSFQNVRLLHWWQSLFWILLGVCTIPLHLW